MQLGLVLSLCMRAFVISLNKEPRLYYDFQQRDNSHETSLVCSTKSPVIMFYFQWLKTTNRSRWISFKYRTPQRWRNIRLVLCVTSCLSLAWRGAKSPLLLTLLLKICSSWNFSFIFQVRICLHVSPMVKTLSWKCAFICILLLSWKY